MDIVKIAQVAAGECVKQEVGLDRLSMLLKAYDSVYTMGDEGLDWLTPYGIQTVAAIIEPVNRYGFRKIPVTFRSGGTAANAERIPTLIGSLITHINLMSVDDWVKEFLWIHPFLDANGRLAWILFNLLNNTLDNPEPLPNFFG